MATAEQNRAHRAACEKVDCWCKKSGKSGVKPRTCPPFITIDGEAILCGWTLKIDANGTVPMPKIIPERLKERLPVVYAALSRLFADTKIPVTPTDSATAISRAVSSAVTPNVSTCRKQAAVILVGSGWVYLKNVSAVRSLLGEELLEECVAALGEEDHSYCLLAASTGEGVGSPGVDVSSADCLRFLLRLAMKHHPGKGKPGVPIYCGFALGYDCEHWIRDYGPSLWKALREKGEGMVKLDGKTYVISYLPKKWFKIGFYGKGGRFVPIIAVFDVFPFFQAGFVPTVGSPATGQKKGWGAATPDEIAILKEWKGKRGSFAAEDWEAIRAYNQIECRVLVRLMNRLRAALEEAGVYLQSWHGPGAVANYLLKKYKMKEHIAKPPAEAVEAIARSYFGGRFECLRFGHLKGVYDYDISSAYPYATTLLPSTRGRWKRVDTWQGEEAPWTVYRVSWKLSRCGAGQLKPFPWRDDRGCIHFPSYGHGWYWAWEVAAAKVKWGDKIVIEEGWRLYPDEEDVFAWLREMAEKRVEAKGKADDKSLSEEERWRWRAIERAYKLALNSVYGKSIQTVGEHKPFLCPMWASLITSHTRSRLLAAAIKAPKGSLVCFATDGLFSTAPIAGMPSKSDEEPALGDWSLEADDIQLGLYQSGCYAMTDRDGEPCGDRFRGIAREDVPWDEFRAAWKKNSLFGRACVTTRRFYGHRTALARNKPELQCQWVDVTKEIELHPGNGFPWPFYQQDKETCVWEAMWPGVEYNEVSARYRKLPAAATEEELDEEDVQPD